MIVVQRHAPTALHSAMTLCLLYRRLSGVLGRSGRALKIFPPPSPPQRDSIPGPCSQNSPSKTNVIDCKDRYMVLYIFLLLYSNAKCLATFTGTWQFITWIASRVWRSIVFIPVIQSIGLFHIPVMSLPSCCLTVCFFFFLCFQLRDISYIEYRNVGPSLSCFLHM